MVHLFSALLFLLSIAQHDKIAVQELAVIGRGVVHQALWSPDGNTIAVASSRGIWLFDANHLENEPRLLEGHSGPVRVLAFHPNGKILASGSYDDIQVDPFIRLWNIDSGELLSVLEGHTDNVGTLTFSADGQYLLSGGWMDDASIRIWNFDETTATASTMAVIPVIYNQGIINIALSQTNEFIAFTTAYNRGHEGIRSLYVLRFEDLLAGITMNAVDNSYLLFAVAFNPVTDELASSDYETRIWKDQSIVYEKVFAPAQGTFDVQYNHSGSLLAVANGDLTIHLLDTSTNEIRTTIDWGIGQKTPFRTVFGEMYSVSFSPDDTRMVSALLDNTVRIWDVNSGQEIIRLNMFTPPVSDFALLEDNQIFAAGLTYDRQIRIWDRTGSTHEFKSIEGHPVTEIFVSPIGDKFAYLFYDWNDTVSPYILHDVSSRTDRLLTVKGGFLPEFLGFSDDGKIAVLDISVTTGYGSQSCRMLIDLENINIIKEVCDQPFSHIALNQSLTKYAASNIGDEKITIRDFEGERPVIWAKTSQWINSLQLDSSDTFLAAGTGYRYESSVEPGAVVVFKSATGEKLFEFSGHTDIIPVLAFNPDSTLLASGSWDGTVGLWDLESGESVAVLDSHTDEITQIRFSADGHTLASSSNDGTIRLWELK